MNTTIQTENEKTLVTLEGRLDTTNVTDFEKQIQPLLTLSNPDIIMECENFNYISSSGLRLFLTLQKKVLANRGKMVLKNMKPEIKEVFDMTGFSSIFTIE